MSNNLIKLLATFFYVGRMPLAPGSLASFVGALVYVCLYGNLWLYLMCVAALAAIGFFVGGKMEKILAEKDPGCIVIDEVVGVLIAFFMLPLTWPVLITAFFLFRAFDMFKIYPVDKFEDLEGGTGIMMDDVIAGLYTNLVMHSALWLSRNVLP